MLILGRYSAGAAEPPAEGTATITAGANWDGTADSGTQPAAMSTATLGSGWTQEVICGFDTPDYMWFEDETTPVIVGAAVGNRGGIDYVEFYLEDSTPVTVDTPTWNATRGIWGYQIIPLSKPGTYGHARLRARAYPVNGKPYEISMICILNTDGTYTRPNRYINFSTGNDSWDGASATFVSGTTGPWKTIHKAQTACTDAAAKGAVVHAAGVTFSESDNTGTFNNNLFTITFQPGSGVASKAPVYTWLSRSTNSASRGKGAVLEKCRRWIMKDFTVGMENISFFYGSNTATTPSDHIFQNCDLIDANGVGGPVFNNPAWIYVDGVSSVGNYGPLSNGGYPFDQQSSGMFRTVEGSKYSLLECEVEVYNLCGASLYRNVTGETAFDAIKVDAGFNAVRNVNIGSNTHVFNYNIQFLSVFMSILHTTDTLEISTVSYDAVNNRTNFTVVAGPTLANHAAGSWNSGGHGIIAKFITGPAVGQGTANELQNFGGFRLGTVNNATLSFGVEGDARAAVAGNLVRLGSWEHSDSLQYNQNNTATTPNHYNCYIYGYKATDPNALGGNIMLIQPSAGGAGIGTVDSNSANFNIDFVAASGGCTISTTGTTISLSNTSSGLAAGQLVKVGSDVRRVSTLSGTSGTLVTAFPTNVPAGSAFSRGQFMMTDDWIRLTSGSQAGQTRRVVSFDESAGTGVLESAFTAAQSNATYLYLKSVNGLAFVNSMVHSESGGLAQVSGPVRNLVLIQSAVLGNLFFFRDNLGSPWGLGPSIAIDTVFNEVRAEVSIPSDWSTSNIYDESDSGAITYNASFYPASGLPVLATPMIPRYLDQTERPDGGPIGPLPYA